MATKDFRSPRYKLPLMGQFLESYLRLFSQVSTAATGAARKYFDRLYGLIARYEEIVLDADGSILSWNNQFTLLEGYLEGEIIGQNFNLLVPPQERQGKLIEGLFTKASRSGTAIYYGQLVRKDGTLFPGSIKIVRVRWKGKILGFIARCRKIKSATLCGGIFQRTDQPFSGSQPGVNDNLSC